MATGRYTRVDGKKSSNCCSTAVIVVLVSACLLAAWFTMSSSVDPSGNVGMSALSSSTKDVKTQKISEKSSNEFEDNTGDLPEVGTKENVEEASGKDENDSRSQENENTEEAEKARDSSQEKKSEDDGERSDDNKEKETESGKNDDASQQESEENTDDSKLKTGKGEDKSGSDESSDSTKDKTDEMKDETSTEGQEKYGADESKETTEKAIKSGSEDQAELLKEASTKTGAWSTQAAESEKEKQNASVESSSSENQKFYKWKVCNVTAGPDYIPCLDNIQAIKRLPSTSHYEHRERHCPDEAPTCLVSLPEGYKTSVKWPKSREKVHSSV